MIANASSSTVSRSTLNGVCLCSDSTEPVSVLVTPQTLPTAPHADRRRTFGHMRRTSAEQDSPYANRGRARARRCSSRRSGTTSTARSRPIRTTRRWWSSRTGRRWTYRELNHDVDLFARGLIAGGIVKGDRVGVWAPNCAEWTIAQYATAKIGAILVNVNPAYRTHEFSYAVNQSGMRMLIAAESFKTSDYRAMVERDRGRLPRARAGDLHRHQRLGGRGRGGPARRLRRGERADADPAARTTRSTSSTRPAPRATRRAPRSATATSSTTAT